MTARVPILSESTFWLSSSKGALVNVLAFSPSADYLAVGFENGLVRIYKNSGMDWLLHTKFKAQFDLRCFSWHPEKKHRVVFGLRNGDLVRMILNRHREEHQSGSFTKVDNFHGCINHCVFSPGGENLAVVFGNQLACIDFNYFHEDILRSKSLINPAVEGIVPTIQGVHFRDKEHIIICFLDSRMGIIVYNVQTLAMIQRFNMRPENTLIGSSAISPSTRYLVVTNVFDGLDWFDTNTGNYLFTSRLKVTHEAATDVKFLSEHVVAVAYRRNRFIMTTMSNKTSPIFFKYLQGVPGTITERLAAGYTRTGRLLIAASSRQLNPTDPENNVNIVISHADNWQKDRFDLILEARYYLLRTLAPIRSKMERHPELNVGTIATIACISLYSFLYFLAAIPGARYVLPAAFTNTITTTSTHTYTDLMKVPVTQVDTTTFTKTLSTTVTDCAGYKSAETSSLFSDFPILVAKQ